MNYKLKDILDIPLLQNLQDKLNVIYSFPSAIADKDGEILAEVGWQDVCTKFYRIHQKCSLECIKSDQNINSHINETDPAVSFQCPHGLLNSAIPIIINDQHLGNFFTGQFFLESPNLEIFNKQAQKFGFEEKSYLEAVQKVPVWTKEKLHQYRNFFRGFIEIIVGNRLKDLKEKEINTRLQKSKDQNSIILQTAMDGFCIFNLTGHLLDVNETYCNMSGYSREEILTMQITDFEAIENLEATKEHIHKIIANKKDRFLTRHLRKDGSTYDVEISVQFHPSYDHNLVAFIRDISRQVQIEKESVSSREKAMENEEKLKSIIESSEDFIWTVDPVNFGIQTCNSALYDYYFKIYGIKIQIGDTPEILFPSEVNDWKFFYSQALEHGKYETEYVLTPQNHIFSLSLNRLVLNSKVLGISVFGRDITKLKQNENEILRAKITAEESEAHFRSIIDNTQAGYFFIDNKGIFRNTNKAWLDLYKYDSYDEVIGKHFTTVQQIDDVDAAVKVVEAIMQGDSASMQGEFSRKCKDGSIGYHSFSSHPVLVNDKIVGIEGFIIDVTKLKETEFKLLEAKEIAEKNEKRYHSLFVSMQEGVYLHEMVYDAEGNAVNYRIVDANPISEKYLNIPRDIAIGKLATELYGTKDAPFLDIYARVSETGEPHSFEQYFEPMDKYFFISVFSPKKGDFATVFLDITQLKKSEIELIAAKEQAEESDRLKTAFLQNMSHEIRTPMNAIMGFAELLPRNFNDKEKLARFSVIINQRCIDLLDIINDILDIAKIESGQLPVNISNVMLSSVFSELNLFFREYQIKINKQHISFEIKSDLDSDMVYLETDKVKLKQIFINLISNAFKFTDGGKVEIGYTIRDNQLVFFVADTGIGIPAEKHQVIFDRFTQLEKGDARLYGGTGLGLSIVKGLVQLLGGKVWLKSKPESGSIFFFTIDHGKYSESTDSQNIMSELSVNYQFPGKKIMIVEDDSFNADYLIELLSEKGLQLLLAKTGQEAINKSIESSPDIILMDIGLPDITGYEAIHQILMKQPEIKIIAQTGYASSEDRNKALRIGCIDYISKPINEKKLLCLLAKYLIPANV